jgi:hypothetical protein
MQSHFKGNLVDRANFDIPESGLKRTMVPKRRICEGIRRRILFAEYTRSLNSAYIQSSSAFASEQLRCFKTTLKSKPKNSDDKKNK